MKVLTTHADITIAQSAEEIPTHPDSIRISGTASIMMTSMNNNRDIITHEYCSAREGVAKKRSVTRRMATATDAYLYDF